jgi:hypothetical protein
LTHVTADKTYTLMIPINRRNITIEAADDVCDRRYIAFLPVGIDPRFHSKAWQRSS